MQQLFQTTERWRAGEIDDAAYASLYFLHWQVHTHGKRFASRRSKMVQKPDSAAWIEDISGLSGEGVRDYLLRFFSHYQFLGVIANVPEALSAWLRGEWPLVLCEHIPSPCAVLGMQTAGTRPVTVLSGWPRMLQPVLSKPNGFAFMVHDLEHAWKFYHDPAMHVQQRDFFRLLLTAKHEGLFGSYLSDAQFSTKFDYLISDMNTHTMHAAQFLRAILMEFHLRRMGVGKPDELPPAVMGQVSSLLGELLGKDWMDEVERRMISVATA